MNHEYTLSVTSLLFSGQPSVPCVFALPTPTSALSRFSYCNQRSCKISILLCPNVVFYMRRGYMGDIMLTLLKISLGKLCLFHPATIGLPPFTEK